jgi:catechol 2,3-dioxygenase-like lactoylglutathione lyase family enzyme
MKVYRISAITLKVKDMEKSCLLYSKIPGFMLTYGGERSDSFTTFKVGKGNNAAYLNLELIGYDGSYDDDFYNKSNTLGKIKGSEDFGRIIFHAEDVDQLYSYMKNNDYISKSIVFENEPMNAPWGERFFHIREPNGYQLSFAQPLS